MDRVTIACVQQQVRVCETQEEYQEDVYRFMRMAQNKEARLIVFPELSGMMLVYPFLPKVQRNLLKQVDKGGRQNASLLSRVIGRVAGSATEALGGTRQSLGALLEHSGDQLRAAYIDLFATAAREFGIYVVGGSLYLRDSLSNAIHHTLFVFAPDGEVMGQQNKVNLHIEEAELCTSGEDFHTFATEFGRFGVLIGADVLYPESARLLAFEGVEMLLNVAACPGQLAFKKMRLGLQSAVQANQVFGLQSFLVGKNIWSQIYVEDYTGKSALLAPMELTASQTGTIYEVGTAVSEGFVATDWDLHALSELWATSETRLRQEMNVAVYKKLIPEVYARGLTIAQSYHPTTGAPPAPEPVSEEPPAEAELPEVPQLVQEIVREPIAEPDIEPIAPPLVQPPVWDAQEEALEGEDVPYTLPPVGGEAEIEEEEKDEAEDNAVEEIDGEIEIEIERD